MKGRGDLFRHLHFNKIIFSQLYLINVQKQYEVKYINSNWKQSGMVLVNTFFPFHRGICSDDEVLKKVEHMIPYLADAYQEICESQSRKKDFFGLRDYYR